MRLLHFIWGPPAFDNFWSFALRNHPVFHKNRSRMFATSQTLMLWFAMGDCTDWWLGLSTTPCWVWCPANHWAARVVKNFDPAWSWAPRNLALVLDLFILTGHSWHSSETEITSHLEIFDLGRQGLAKRAAKRDGRPWWSCVHLASWSAMQTLGVVRMWSGCGQDVVSACDFFHGGY